MINIGEQIVASYLRYIKGCNFIQTNVYTVETQGEIDVVGIDLERKKVYICEVAIHLTTGLQYTKDKRPNNVGKLCEKFGRDIQYAEAFFPDHERHYMLWSPIVRSVQNPVYNQLAHLDQINTAIKAICGVEIEFVVNDRFLSALTEMRAYARKATADLKCPVMRLMQVEEYLEKHVAKIGATPT